jgi:hypothetical protein
MFTALVDVFFVPMLTIQIHYDARSTKHYNFVYLLSTIVRIMENGWLTYISSVFIRQRKPVVTDGTHGLMSGCFIQLEILD